MRSYNRCVSTSWRFCMTGSVNGQLMTQIQWQVKGIVQDCQKQTAMYDLLQPCPAYPCSVPGTDSLQLAVAGMAGIHRTEWALLVPKRWRRPRAANSPQVNSSGAHGMKSKAGNLELLVLLLPGRYLDLCSTDPISCVIQSSGAVACCHTAATCYVSPQQNLH